MTDLTTLAELLIKAGKVRGNPAPDPVNVPMIRHWLAAMGDRNPVYLERELAPPAMAQVWTMTGPDKSARKVRTPVAEMLEALTEAGYTGVVATNCEHTYHRYAKVGELPVPSTRLVEVAGPKETALGEGYFVTWNVTWSVAGDPVAEMLFRVLRFRRPRRPAEPRSGYPLRPAINQDTRFFWEGAKAGELRIQRCEDCGEPRHPPGPMCPACRSANRGYTIAAGTGEVYSFVVHHHPPIPGRETPLIVAVVELPEGVRVVGNVIGCDPAEVSVGLPVAVTYERMDDDLTLPMWRPRR